MFAGHGRMVHALRGLVAHPADDRNARMAEDHQRVVQAAHYASKLEFQNGIETTDDVLGIDLVVVTGHRVLLTIPTGTKTHQLGPSGCARRRDTQSASWFGLLDARSRPAPCWPHTSGTSSDQVPVWWSWRLPCEGVRTSALL